MNDNRMLKAWALAVFGAPVLVPLLVACGGGSNNPPPNTAPTASVGMGQPPPGYPPTAAPPGYPGTAPPPGYPQGSAPGTTYPQPQPTGYPTAPPTAPPAASAPPGPLAPTDPNSLQGILAGIQGALQGTVVPGGAMSGDLADIGLKAQAVRVAPGMQAEGDEMKQTLSEGQHAVMMVTMQAGKCYAVIGFSPPGAVKDLDLNLLAPPFYMTLAGQDLTHNNTPVIGGAPSPMCPVTPFPLQYKLDVLAKSGSGQVAVQLYSKTK